MLKNNVKPIFETTNAPTLLPALSQPNCRSGMVVQYDSTIDINDLYQFDFM